MNDGRDFDQLLLPLVMTDKANGDRGGSAGHEHYTTASAENACHLNIKDKKKRKKTRTLIHVRDTYTHTHNE